MRYQVESLGRAGRAALVVDSRTHAVVLRLSGPDQWTLADAIATLLNESPTETPVEQS